jgi:hypothetical protein
MGLLPAPSPIGDLLGNESRFGSPDQLWLAEGDPDRPRLANNIRVRASSP